jgi:hypothetical protein
LVGINVGIRFGTGTYPCPRVGVDVNINIDSGITAVPDLSSGDVGVPVAQTDIGIVVRICPGTGVRFVVEVDVNVYIIVVSAKTISATVPILIKGRFIVKERTMFAPVTVPISMFPSFPVMVMIIEEAIVSPNFAHDFPSFRIASVIYSVGDINFGQSPLIVKFNEWVNCTELLPSLA